MYYTKCLLTNNFSKLLIFPTLFTSKLDSSSASHLGSVASLDSTPENGSSKKKSKKKKVKNRQYYQFEILLIIHCVQGIVLKPYKKY